MKTSFSVDLITVNDFYHAQTKFLHLSVILFTGIRGLHPGDLHPGRSASGGGLADPPRILRDTVNKKTVRILLECILVI